MSDDIDEYYLSLQENAFQSIDPILNQFQKDFGFLLDTSFKDYQIRIFKVPYGEIEVSQPAKGPYIEGKIRVYLRGKFEGNPFSFDWLATKEILYDVLVKALEISNKSARWK